MKIKKNNWMNWLIVAMWNKTSLPKSLCTYFWTLVVTLVSALIFLPCVLIHAIVPSFRRDVNRRLDQAAKSKNSDSTPSGFGLYLISYGTFVIITCLGYGLLEEVFKYDVRIDVWYDYILTFSVGILASGITISGTILIVWLLYETRNKIANKISEEKNTLLGKRVEAAKNKVCPTIEYED